MDGIAIIIPEGCVYSDRAVHRIPDEDDVLIDETSMEVERILHSDVDPRIDSDTGTYLQDKNAVASPHIE